MEFWKEMMGILLVKRVRNSSSDRQAEMMGESEAEKLVSFERNFHASINFSLRRLASKTIFF